MYKKALITGFSVLALVFSGVAFAENKGAESMSLKGGSPGDVPFPHKVHQEKVGDCKACHSLFPEEKGAIDKLIAAGTLKKKDAMKQCQNCHKDNKDKGVATGPTKCNECHKK